MRKVSNGRAQVDLDVPLLQVGDDRVVQVRLGGALEHAQHGGLKGWMGGGGVRLQGEGVEREIAGCVGGRGMRQQGGEMCAWG